jgi:hypothetical protein
MAVEEALREEVPLELQDIITKESLEEFYEDNCGNQQAYKEAIAGIDNLLRLNTTAELLELCQEVFGRKAVVTKGVVPLATVVAIDIGAPA